MVNEADEPYLGSADAPPIDPNILRALEAVRESDNDQPDAPPKSNISITVDGKEIPPEVIEPRSLMSGMFSRNRRKNG